MRFALLHFREIPCPSLAKEFCAACDEIGGSSNGKMDSALCLFRFFRGCVLFEFRGCGLAALGFSVAAFPLNSWLRLCDAKKIAG
jgi:hypothetical protein